MPNSISHAFFQTCVENLLKGPVYIKLWEILCKFRIEMETFAQNQPEMSYIAILEYLSFTFLEWIIN